MICTHCGKEIPDWLRRCPNSLCQKTQAERSISQKFGWNAGAGIYTGKMLRDMLRAARTSPQRAILPRTSVVAVTMIISAVTIIIVSSLLFIDSSVPLVAVPTSVAPGLVIAASTATTPATATSASVSVTHIVPTATIPVTIQATEPPVATAVPTVVIAATPLPASSLAVPTVVIVNSAAILIYISCIVHNSDDTFTAYWQYSNTTGMTQQIAIGANNAMTPDPLDWGQTTTFMIGNTTGLFHTRPAPHATTLVWHLTWNAIGNTATATWNSPICKTASALLTAVDPLVTGIPAYRWHVVKQNNGLFAAM